MIAVHYPAWLFCALWVLATVGLLTVLASAMYMSLLVAHKARQKSVWHYGRRLLGFFLSHRVRNAKVPRDKV